MPPTWPTVPEWMRACASCAQMAAAYREAAQAHRIGEGLTVRALLETHLVAEHLGALPGPVEGCADCAEWEALASAEAGRTATPTATRALTGEALRHRAAHLFVPRA